MMEPNVGQILEKWALLTLNREGLVGWESGRRFKYRELDERANRIANLLRGLGMKKGDRVSIMALNGVHFVDIFFEVGKLGAIFVLLNWRLAAPEQEYILNDSEPTVLLYGPEFNERILRQTPVKRFGTPEGIASLVAFLVSPASDFFTSQVFGPNGGLVI